MRRILKAVFAAAVAAGIVALGVAVAGLASTLSSGRAAQTTSETTTETTTSETTTTENSTTTKYRAVLTARAEVPRPKGVRPGAGGTFSLELTESGGSYTVAWTLAYRKLTGRAQAAHIHRGKVGKAGPVLVTLCRPCRSGRKGERSVSTTVASAMRAGVTYVNVHTAVNPAGEIRGQLRKAS